MIQQGNIFGLNNLPTFNLTIDQAEAINLAATGRKLANQIGNGQDAMDQAYGGFKHAYECLIIDLFSDEVMPNMNEFTVADYIILNAVSWDTMGTIDDIRHHLSGEMAFILNIQ